MRGRWTLPLVVAVVATVFGLVAATADASGRVARAPAAATPGYPPTLTGSVKGDCTAGWDYHLSIANVIWKEADQGRYEVFDASGVQLTSKMADGTYWTRDSSKPITGSLLFFFPPSQYAPYALLSVPATRHYPSGDTSSDDQGLGFGNTGTLKINPDGQLEITFDRKFDIPPAGNLPGSSCEMTADFVGEARCAKELAAADKAYSDYLHADDEFSRDAGTLEEIENRVWTAFLGFGPSLYVALEGPAQSHDVAKARYLASKARSDKAWAEYQKRKKALDDCQNGKAGAAMPRTFQQTFQATATQPCTDADRNRLLARGGKLRLLTLAPRVRAIGAEVKAGEKQKATRDFKRLKSAFAAERKRMNAFAKALKACG